MKNPFKFQSSKSVFVNFLEHLGVPHTKAYAKKLYNEHPHKYNLYGLSDMLSTYGIATMGIHMKDKAEIATLEAPFIAHIGTTFVSVYKSDPKQLHYVFNGMDIKTTPEQFADVWTGNLLLAETDEQTMEPDYRFNLRKERFRAAQNAAIGVLLLGMVAVFAYAGGIFYNIWQILLLLTNLAGIYIGYLLVLKQVHIHSEYADKICSLFKKSNCNDVLETPAAKLGGVIGWSKIGLGYFIANLLVMLIFPGLWKYMVWINIAALPYTVWSIWYQRFVAKQWCPLCLIVQVILWVLACIHLINGWIGFPVISPENIMVVVAVYIVPMLSINLLVPVLAQAGKIEQATQELNSIKADENVFLSLLTKQPYYENIGMVSGVIFGNPQPKNLVSILTNPHCNPCGKMHLRVDALLEDNKDITVQYIFLAFGDELLPSNRFLIAVYRQKPYEEAMKIFTEWFVEGKLRKEEYFAEVGVVMDDPTVEEELQRHTEWKDSAQVSATPTVFFNGYKLPDNYKIEDLKNFAGMDFSGK